LVVRLPSPSPVVPSSPVRVAILESRLPILDKNKSVGAQDTGKCLLSPQNLGFLLILSRSIIGQRVQ
jgi:hypothetical protein